ncbi:MAG TPA: thioesterase family protein [Acidimicrobiales bacterium]|nr:thioesterase family protein [Acidimicrobiales bacterium]
MEEKPEPIRCWNSKVPHEWIDYNNHLTEGYYGVVFGYAGDKLLEELGFGTAYLNEQGTFYTVESRIRFLREIHVGAEIYTHGWVLGCDEKRLHWLQELYVEGNSEPAATQEALLLHVIQGQEGESPKVGPMKDPILSIAQEFMDKHLAFSFPSFVGQSIRSLR